MRSRPAVVAGAVVAVCVTALLAHEGHAPLPTRGVQVDPARGHLLLTPAARDALDVSTAVVEVRPVEDRLLAHAAVTLPWARHGFATARLPGRVSKVSVAPGQTVRAGDVVAEVRSLDLDTLQQDVLIARTEIALSEKTLADLRASAAAGAVAEQQVIDAEGQLARTRNALALARAKWLALGLPAETFDAVLRDGTPVPDLALPVRVPVGGTVIHAELTVGRVVEPADHLAEVADLSTVWVQIGVLEKDLRRVAVGSPVEVRLAAHPGRVFPAAVAAVAPYLDPVTHVAAAWAELANPPGREPTFVPGMAGQAEVIVPSDRPRPTVPAAAVVRQGVERFVLVEEANAAGASEYRKKPVAVGRASGGRVELLAGEVFPGDRVVVRGAHELGGYFVPEVLRPSAEAARAIGLLVEPAGPGTIDDIVTLDGAADLPPADRGSAASPLAGTITAIHTDRGRVVTAGDVLAEVSSPELLTLQLDLIRTGLDLALEEGTLGRIRALPAVARRRVWEAEGRVAVLKSQADTLRRKLSTAGLTAAQVAEVERSQRVVPAVPVRSPVAGTVLTFDKAVGQATAANEPLFAVHAAGRPLVRGFVPERDRPRVAVGMPARVRLVADPAAVLTGRVVRSGRAVGADSRAENIWVELDPHPGPPLVHAQLARVTVVTGTHPAAVAVPLAAVADDNGLSVVFVRGADGVFDRRVVDLGRADDRRVEVVGGLSPGESVAVAGAADLAAGFAALR